MFPRLTWGLPATCVPCLLALLLLLGAPGAARAQGAGAGATLELKSLDVTITVPDGAGEWIVRGDGGDVLQRTKPVNPYLSVIFERTETAGRTCADIVGEYAKKGLKKAKQPSLVPAGWHTQILAAASGNGELVVLFCAAENDRQLVAMVTYGGQLADPDLANITPVLEAVGTAVFTAKPAAKPDEPKPDEPKPDVARDDEPNRVALPATGMVLLIPADGNTWVGEAGGGGKDLIRRTLPAEPALAVRVEVVRTNNRPPGGCAGILDQQMQVAGKGTLQASPGYLPDGYHENVAETYQQGAGRGLACAEIPVGYLLATVIYAGSLDSEDAQAARPVLAATLVGAAKLTRPSGKRGSLLGGDSMMSPEVYVGGQSLAISEDLAAGGFEDGFAFVLGVRQAGLLRFSGDSAFGLAGRYQFNVGWDTTHELMLDGVIAIGAGATIGKKVTIMGVVGGGGDAIGAGSKVMAGDGKLKMDFEIYNYYGVVMLIEFHKRVGLELTGALLERGDKDEIRIDGRFMVLPASFRKVSLGLSYVDIDTVATSWGLLLGLGF